MSRHSIIPHQNFLAFLRKQVVDQQRAGVRMRRGTRHKQKTWPQIERFNRREPNRRALLRHAQHRIQVRLDGEIVLACSNQLSQQSSAPYVA